VKCRLAGLTAAGAARRAKPVMRDLR